jgi:hypothetical protein
MNIVPFAGALAVSAWARVPDRFVRHLDVGLEGLLIGLDVSSLNPR